MEVDPGGMHARGLGTLKSKYEGLHIGDVDHTIRLGEPRLRGECSGANPDHVPVMPITRLRAYPITPCGTGFNR